MKQIVEIHNINKQREGEDFISFLRHELTERCRRNPSYSLRSFASYLGVSSSFLSKLLNRKRSLTFTMLNQFSERLNIDPSKYDQYLKNILSNDHISSSPTLHSLSLDEFEIISDWYYFAILELISMENFQNSPRWIANCLGISFIEAKEALQKLKNLNYITENNGKLIATNKNNTTIGAQKTATAYQKQQKQILEKATEALYSTPFDLRSQSSVTM